MFLKFRERRKDGKVHRTWSVAESRRYPGGKLAHRHLLYLGEINDVQRTAWQRTIEVIDERADWEKVLRVGVLYRLISPGSEWRLHRHFGYSRDRRSDCVQVIIALVVTPDGLPLAYETLPGNTAHKTTLRNMLARVQGTAVPAGSG